MNPITFPSDGIDVNTANVEMLDTLPGIGPVLAQAIIDAREKEPFHYPEDLLDVYGIGEKTLDKLYNLIRITEVTP